MKPHFLIAIFFVSPLFWGSISEGHGAHDEFVAECLEELQAKPGDLDVHHKLAMAYVRHGDWELALVELDQLDGTAIDSRLTRAQALMLGGRHEEARKLLDSVLENSPKNTQALLERARVFAALNQPLASLADYRGAMSLTPSPDPLFCLEMAEMLIAQSQSKEALAVIQKGLAARGDVPTLLMRAMEMEIAAADYDAALARMTLLEKQAPRPEPWMARRAELLAQAGRAGESRTAWSALKQRIAALPNLQRGTPELLALAAKADAALTSL